MSDLGFPLWLIPALPLLAAAVCAAMAFFVPKHLRGYAHWPAILGAAAACVLSFVVLFHAGGHGEPHKEGGEAESSESLVKEYYTWYETGDFKAEFALRRDALTALMLVTVTFVGTLITVYAAGYMHGDPGYPRFFFAVALFVAAMLLLVMADNFILLYAGWEGVGLCSYLLIGHWFEKPSAANAARKAFLTTRIGDAGMMLGIMLLWTQCGWNLNYDAVFARAPSLDPGLLTTACLLLFCGAVGKSAQFPLHVWLPDAMEGPTPVSALIHAATMVTAGVYLVARCTPLFVLAPAAQLTVACVGGFTALFAALIALTQNDLKRVLAYSTISQLGYMFLAVGSGAVTAGMFHLFTHAFFKALLFLSAGSVMHAMGGVIDMRRLGGLRKLMPITHATFLVGAAALSALPFITSGFWSKDEILAGTLFHQTANIGAGWVYTLLFVVGLLTAGLTAFYTFRGYFLTFWGEEKVPPEAHGHAHESPPVMWVPLTILAAGALLVGYVNAEPVTHYLSEFLRETPRLGSLLAEEPLTLGTQALMWLGSIAMAAAGILGAWYVYVRRPGTAARMAGSSELLYQASVNKFFVDELYDLAILKPLAGLTEFANTIDFVIDETVNLIARLTQLLGKLFRPVQNGLVQFYALAIILALTVFLIALARSM